MSTIINQPPGHQFKTKQLTLCLLIHPNPYGIQFGDTLKNYVRQCFMTILLLLHVPCHGSSTCICSFGNCYSRANKLNYVKGYEQQMVNVNWTPVKKERCKGHLHELLVVCGQAIINTHYLLPCPLSTLLANSMVPVKIHKNRSWW